MDGARRTARVSTSIPVLSIALLAWGCSSARPAQERCPEPEERRVSADLEPFLTSYFSSWSHGDMEGYAGHFHEDAVIMFVSDGEVRARMPLEPFIEDQARMQRDEEARAAERMTRFRADEDEQAATVTVDWLLERGEGQERGVDRFTLIRDAERHWKIAALVFYVTDRGGGGE